jgi:tRNA A-37 threonylcarbamoyl transferase component Bud32
MRAPEYVWPPPAPRRVDTLRTPACVFRQMLAVEESCRGKEKFCNVAPPVPQETGTMHSTHCPACHSPIPADAPGGICPACALLGVAQPTVILPPLGAAGMDEVAAAFPDMEILELIGQGGMGVVYKARQPRLDRLVALKILPLHLAAQPGFAERFTREARALARLSHPHIVAVYDFGESGGFYYLVMEFVDGVNLRQAMRAGIKPEQAMLLVPRVCEALQFAHDRGVLHRDIKPENILLDRSGTPKLADFGIAKFSGDIPGSLTMSGAALGTAAYMAPEQVEKPATVDHRADIYSLGVVFYEMLTGELPLGRFAAPSEKAKVGEGVDAVVMRALEKERERRQQSAGEMKTQVESAGITAAAPRPADRRHRRHGHNGFQRLALALCMLCGAMIPVSGMLRLNIPSQTFVAATILFGVLVAIAGIFRRHDEDLPELKTAAGQLHAAAAEMGHAAYPRIARQPFESISRRRVLGMPLYHVVRGPDPATGRTHTARGFFAIGPTAIGVFALGGRACGLFALGGLAIGGVSLGGLSLGAFAFGGAAAALLAAAGGLAVAPLALGGSAIGVVGIGGGSLAFECLAAQAYWPGSEPLGALYHKVLTIAGAAGGITVLLGMILLQMSFFAREPAAGEAPRPSAWLRRFLALYFLAALAAAGWLFVDQIQPRLPHHAAFSRPMLMLVKEERTSSSTTIVWQIERWTSEPNTIATLELDGQRITHALQSAEGGNGRVMLRTLATGPVVEGDTRQTPCAIQAAFSFSGGSSLSVPGSTLYSPSLCEIPSAPPDLPFGEWRTLATIDGKPLRLFLRRGGDESLPETNGYRRITPGDGYERITPAESTPAPR